MGGFFGAVSEKNVLADVFFGTDYHSHLGTKSAGIAAFDREMGLQRDIHNIGNAPFRTKFSGVFDEIRGTAAIGTINDTDPQPLLVRSALGRYAISFVGVINNKEELIEEYIRMTRDVIDAGAAGVTYGRFVITYPHITALVKTLSQVIHNGMSVKEAMTLLSHLEHEEENCK